jgi:hypothetical protein
MGILDRKASEYSEDDDGNAITNDCTCTEQGRDIVCSNHGG